MSTLTQEERKLGGQRAYQLYGTRAPYIGTHATLATHEALNFLRDRGETYGDRTDIYNDLKQALDTTDNQLEELERYVLLDPLMGEFRVRCERNRVPLTGHKGIEFVELLWALLADMGIEAR